jgi:hypothetical protein
MTRRLDGFTGTLGSSQTLKSVRTICHYVQMDATLNCSKLLDIDGSPDRKFSSFRWMFLTDECPEEIPRRPDKCKGTELTYLNFAQSLLEAHN